MLVSVSGYNYSGSSAVIDLLAEYSETNCVKQEIAFAYMPDGLLDLEYNMNHTATYFNGDVAIQRFWNQCLRCDMPKDKKQLFLQKSREYIDSIVEDTWHGGSYFDSTRLSGAKYYIWYLKKSISSLIYHYSKKVTNWNQRAMYLAYCCTNFNTLTSKYLNDIADMFSVEGKIGVFNQFFSAFRPELSMKFCVDGKTIVVDRDPRDIYILGNVRHETACFPSQDAKKFVTWYKRCWDNCVKEESDRVLHVQFEDLIFQYEITVKRIEVFLGIDDHVKPRMYFKPEVSINNTQLKMRFPKLASDIAYIEKELKDYLYVFPEGYKPSGDFF
ncbi:hypothetical protein [Sporofaciens sp. JLR.KK001]|uniref:hypothetical protein n=1 Tax=Sporofaciens sp. JLR.KK001 TaxID=3112621 RepID=UPI002FEE73DE